jgi:multiple sugar transport system ATP-binding protein
VAMGRAIVRNPQAYLMDEPLSNLDAKLRMTMRGQLAALHERLGVTTIYVTHDQIEAMTLGTKVAVLKGGELQQVDTPQKPVRLPRQPVCGDVHRLPGDEPGQRPPVRDQGPALVFADYKVPLDYQTLRGRQGLDRYVDKELIVGIRPSSLDDAAFAAADWPRISSEVAVAEELGSEVNLLFHVAAPPVHHGS